MKSKEIKNMDVAELLQKHQEWIAAKSSELANSESFSEEKLQENIAFNKFIEDNPEIVQKCQDQAIKLIPRMVKTALEFEFESYKFREYLKSKYDSFDKC